MELPPPQQQRSSKMIMIQLHPSLPPPKILPRPKPELQPELQPPLSLPLHKNKRIMIQIIELQPPLLLLQRSGIPQPQFKSPMCIPPIMIMLYCMCWIIFCYKKRKKYFPQYLVKCLNFLRYIVPVFRS